MGTIGWIVANIVISQKEWDESANMFYLAGGAAAAVVMGVFNPASYASARQGPGVLGAMIAGSMRLVLLKNRSFSVFVLCSFLICIPLAAYYALANQFVERDRIRESDTNDVV